MKSSKILVVDDEPFVIRYLRRVLEGFPEVEVQTAETAQEALQRVKAEGMDLVFLDISLPDGDGLEVMREMKALRPGIRVVLFTGVYPDDGPKIKQALKMGAYDYLEKPLPITHLKKIIQEAFA